MFHKRKDKTISCICSHFRIIACELWYAGPEHCWLNKEDGKTKYFKKDGTFLILAAELVEDSLSKGSDYFIMFEKVKFLQKRWYNYRMCFSHSIFNEFKRKCDSPLYLFLFSYGSFAGFLGFLSYLCCVAVQLAPMLVSVGHFN